MLEIHQRCINREVYKRISKTKRWFRFEFKEVRQVCKTRNRNGLQAAIFGSEVQQCTFSLGPSAAELPVL